MNPLILCLILCFMDGTYLIFSPIPDPYELTEEDFSVLEAIVAQKDTHEHQTIGD